MSSAFFAKLCWYKFHHSCALLLASAYVPVYPVTKSAASSRWLSILLEMRVFSGWVWGSSVVKKTINFTLDLLVGPDAFCRTLDDKFNPIETTPLRTSDESNFNVAKLRKTTTSVLSSGQGRTKKKIGVAHSKLLLSPVLPNGHFNIFLIKKKLLLWAMIRLKYTVRRSTTLMADGKI